MQSVQESKQELEAAIRYAENAISSAKGTIESMEFRQEMAKKQYAEQTGSEEALTKQVQELESKVQGQYDDIVMLEREVEVYTQKYNELAKQKDDLESQVNALEQPERATMPVIPKAVAIAIFREGVAHGVEAACTELDNAADISIEENEYCGDFEVSFSKYIDLSDHLDTDWMRGKCGDYSEEGVIDALKGLCADKEFECRIHGIDDNE
jgi:hypothetical protein